ncbi:putative PurR-regulated permease PerM [Aliiruegeria haliotis]|uniref:Putative PurR-regulated permease PerM n=1 Tax=Aliiruegeria haliotis TaxID=1280846 RepID=A0A2T0RLX6_9RHOB|nr:AI-2E family transporter [Aliiruegeria haliotis]PRY22137.1 putative PurR-regulated permease PerM [Aliiruegeria haliotis]
MKSERTPRAHWSVIGLFLMAAVYMLHWAHEFLVPLTAAVLGFFVAWPLDKRLSRLGIPSAVTALLFTGAVAAAIVVAIGVLITPLTTLLTDLPDMIRNVQRDLAGAGGEAMEQLQEAAETAEDALNGDTEDKIEVEVASDTTLLSRLLATAPAVLGQIALSLILMFFLIASGSKFVRSVVQASDNFSDKRKSVETIRAVTDRLGTYLGGITAINAGLGVAIGCAMWMLGLPNPILFGFIAFLFNFVPILGAMAGAGLAAMVGYSESTDLAVSFWVFGTYMAITSIEGQFVTPYLISGRLNLNPAVVFISVAFFAWTWSIIGMVVAVPILVAVKILLDENPSTRAIGRFLGEGEAIASENQDPTD